MPIEYTGGPLDDSIPDWYLNMANAGWDANQAANMKSIGRKDLAQAILAHNPNVGIVVTGNGVGWLAALGVSLFVFTLIVWSNTSRHALPGPGNVATLTSAQVKEKNGPQLDQVVRDLRSDKESERANAKKALLTLANKSAANRESVIKELVRIIKSPRRSEEFVKDPTLYLEWREVTDLLGSIRAVEAIDDLVECLDCNNGVFGLSPDLFPATRAVIRIGQEAIPRLSQVFEHRPPLTRYLAAIALSQIGGDMAKIALEKAMRIEKDKDVASTIKNLLQNWNRLSRDKLNSPHSW
jgi:hypothetical protein